ncbi:type 1 glutamine amidotransferase domain-containing protein [Alkalihalobacillus sp. TS-13]|uniref:type 1 glutamine amidotransferase domain-containing protein n=1 Tax=Alkalihalobacillus sp. TS-13 TaxID=2842455 RepID=UPI001C87551C|nr:type 1 glutamine amidotransferase domain-containing protein [Alkalihalobacillus sp. TS-13]
MSKRILMIVTNADKINDEKETGLWLEEFAVPYNLFINQGYEVTVKSPKGGQIPLDPNSIPEEEKQEFADAQDKLTQTDKLTENDLKEEYDGVFLPGGHGTMFDFPDNELMQKIIGKMADQNKVIGAVCHGPSGLVNVTYQDGTPLVKGKKVNGFTDEEEKEMQLTEEMPFLLETTLREKGGKFVQGDKWTDFSVRDGNLVTGQNPMSSESTAQKLIEALNEQ